MLITMEDGSITDFGVFSVESPFMEVIAVESSFYKTPLSGNEPAIMVFELPSHEVFQTTSFTASSDCFFSEFIISDPDLIGRLMAIFHAVFPGEKLKLRHMGILQALGEWSLFAACYSDNPGDDDVFLFLNIDSVYWTTKSYAGRDKIYL